MTKIIANPKPLDKCPDNYCNGEVYKFYTVTCDRCKDECAYCDYETSLRCSGCGLTITGEEACERYERLVKKRKGGDTTIDILPELKDKK